MTARIGIIGNIYCCDDGSSWGQGLECDAAAFSLRQPGSTFRLDRQDGVSFWFEDGQEIAEPDWAKPDPDWD